MTDLEALKSEIALSSVIGRDVKLLSAGRNEWKGLCPFHNERTPSFYVLDAKRYFYCFGCSAHGDVFDYVMETRRVSFAEALRMLGSPSLAPKQNFAITLAHDPYDGIESVAADETPEPPTDGTEWRIWNPKRERDWRFVPSAVYVYRDRNDRFVGLVARIELGEGRKATPQIRYVQLADGRRCWAIVPFEAPRPLFGAELLRSADRVVVVEGEKSATALATCCAANVVTWAGGTNGWHLSDWMPVAGKTVVLWPDHDLPGIGAMRKIALMLQQLSCRVSIAWPPATAAAGWDAADAIADGWRAADVSRFLANAVSA
jgi:hypothetical protein